MVVDLSRDPELPVSSDDQQDVVSNDSKAQGAPSTTNERSCAGSDLSDGQGRSDVKEAGGRRPIPVDDPDAPFSSSIRGRVIPKPRAARTP